MTAVPAAVGKRNVWEGFLIRFIVGIHTIGDPVIGENIKCRIQYSNYGL